MCELENIRLSWHELLPYVNLEPGKNRSIINRTGVVYNFFRESLAECCGSEAPLHFAFRYDQQANQQAVLNTVQPMAETVGMPISLDAEFPYVPVEFVPVLQTDGLFWVKVKEPEMNALGGISANGLSILAVVITMTGYAAVILWLLVTNFDESMNKRSRENFIRGIFESYWFAFITITTIGYGDRVPETFAAKLFTMIWILFGICLVSTFTAIITTVMASLGHETQTVRPFYDEFIGVLDGSFDYLVLVKKSANSIRYPDMESLTNALNNGSTFNIVMDKHAYWVYRAWIQQNQSFEFQPGVQNPTSVGYMFNTYNSSLLGCLKEYAMQKQEHVTVRLSALVKEAIDLQPPDKVHDNVRLLFGPHTYTVLQTAACLLAAILVCGSAIEYVLLRRSRLRRQNENLIVSEDS